jgi:hypothetical protein
MLSSKQPFLIPHSRQAFHRVSLFSTPSHLLVLGPLAHPCWRGLPEDEIVQIFLSLH